jgi:hypothetical protein
LKSEDSVLNTNVHDFESGLRLQPDTCCFTCYLPTRVCKGPLASNDRGCFSSRLVVCLWAECGRASRKIDLQDTAYFGIDWVPKVFNRGKFQEASWQWDTEVIGAAVFFYHFALSYFSMHGWN